MSDYEPVAIPDEGLKLSDISEMGNIVPVGRYKVKLTRVEAKDSKKNKPMIVAGFDILEGKQAGLEATAYYTMVVLKNTKSGRVIAPGIMDMKATFAAVGNPLPDDFIFPSNPQAAARLFLDRMHPRAVGELEMAVLEEDDREDPTKKRTKVKIIGRWGHEPGAAATATPAAQPATSGAVYA